LGNRVTRDIKGKYAMKYERGEKLILKTDGSAFEVVEVLECKNYIVRTLFNVGAMKMELDEETLDRFYLKLDEAIRLHLWED